MDSARAEPTDGRRGPPEPEERADALTPGHARPERAVTSGDATHPHVAFLSTYVPRRCGIATFTRDLVAGLRSVTDGGARLQVVAIDARSSRLAYAAPVRRRLVSSERSAYTRLAGELAADGVAVLSVQHEYGIFGGRSGVYLLDLLESVSVPVVTTLHTILGRPTPLQERILRGIAERSARLVVMSERGRSILSERYAIEGRRVEVIPHGVPAFDLGQGLAKSRLGLDGQRLVLSSGLLGPHKKVELVLEALARLGGRVRDVRYAVVGATHPNVIRDLGEAYRDQLAQRVRDLGLEGQVLFVDRYVDDRELTTWLAACDVFVTPYEDAQQITSGTLSYALAAGAAVVSTPYEHALELLADGRGVLVPFGDVEALARALAGLLLDDDRRERIRLRAREHARSMRWTRVAARYRDIFTRVARTAPAARMEMASSPTDRRVVSLAIVTGPPVPGSPISLEGLPVARGRLEELPVAREHLGELSDSTGLFQFAHGRVPAPRYGYCTDDMARALLVDIRHAQQRPVPAIADSIRRGLDFLRHAFDAETGRFRNLRLAGGAWVAGLGSEDAHGRAVQALGHLAGALGQEPGLGLDAGAVQRVRALLAAGLPAAGRLRWARPRAYALLGCLAALADPSSAESVWATARALHPQLADSVRRSQRADPSWPWPEDAVTYDNGVLAEALVAGGLALGRPDDVTLGLQTLAWLLRAQTAPSGRLRPVGNRGWWPRGGRPARWDQQPIEPASLVSAAVEAWGATRDDRWAEAAETSLAWFLGENDLGIALADPGRGACRDGLGPDGTNPNEGAESTLAWLSAVERIRELRQARSMTRRISGRGQERTYSSTSERRAVARAMVESAAP